MNSLQALYIMKKTIVLISTVLIVLTFLFACDTKTNDHNKAITEADKLFEQDKYNEAVALYNKALELKPEEIYPAQKIEEINKILEQQDRDNNYIAGIQRADSLFENQNYYEAKFAYIEANKIKPEELYPMDMIADIQKLEEEAQQLKIEESNPYHIIVGSFSIESNSDNMQRMLINEGYDSKILNAENGFYRVTITSHHNIHEAYNNLPTAMNAINEDAWVYHQK